MITRGIVNNVRSVRIETSIEESRGRRPNLENGHVTRERRCCARTHCSAEA